MTAVHSDAVQALIAWTAGIGVLWCRTNVSREAGRMSTLGTYQTVKLEHDNGVTFVIMNRPEKQATR